MGIGAHTGKGRRALLRQAAPKLQQWDQRSDEKHLPEFDAHVEREQRHGNFALGQADLTECAGKSEPMEEAELKLVRSGNPAPKPRQQSLTLRGWPPTARRSARGLRGRRGSSYCTRSSSARRSTLQFFVRGKSSKKCTSLGAL